ncbi:TonB-dependent receptor [Pedobacter hiemivivus]|uniref:TonB-dependent receptor n=1 Tax=Pedobacter hiemivivus TaxID=2530454 RepID=A0A4U1GPS6_9SPHI|nr:TonB-dependent receptor [Pedobacter hiemivivus]TKC65140.1 TonB-dependent receptor [Pedobacter hiemivivus]
MQSKLLYLLGMLFCVFMAQSSYAQNNTSIKGQVTSADEKSGFPGVVIKLKGTSVITRTDVNGKYQIAAPANGVLTFNYIGYDSVSVPVNGRREINVKMQSKDNKLDEVVVIGYGTQKKSDLTGSLSQVKAKDINSYPATNALQALAGRATGVQVLQNTGAPGGGVSVRIRGTNSIQGSNEPLYVIDGFPIAGSNPSVINNSDIESMEILKDASATAIYGSRGANGVVLITTKKGKAGQNQVSFETSYGIQTLRKKMDLMNAQEYATFYNEQAANDKLAPYFIADQIAGMGKGFDIQDLAFRKAPLKTISFGLSGGSDKTQFAIAGSIFGQDGIIKGSSYDRYSINSNVNHEISKKFSVNLSTTITRIKSEAQNSSGGNRGGSLISAIISAPPTLNPYNDDGSYRGISTSFPYVLSNPLNYINEQSNSTTSNRILSNGAIVYKPIPELSIKISGGVENADDRNDAYTTLKFINSKGSANVSATQSTSLLSENTISYNKTFNQKHSVSAVAGFTYQDFLNTSLSGSGNGYISDISETFDLGSATTPGIPGTSYVKSSLLSYLGRLNYAYDSKYLATVSFRADGSSKYSEGNKWGYFPSAALAWRISNEDFLKESTIISDMKLRLGWGYTGSQAINPYATLNQLLSNKTVFGDALFTSYAPGTVLPGNLKWETTEQKNIGIDVGILTNKIYLTADYYIKNTRDLLNTVQLPSSMGFTTTIQNVGEVSNKGLELALNVKPFSGNFSWDINTNISFNRNKVVKLYGGQDILGGAFNVSAVNDYANILREGQPIGIFYGYVENGYDDKGKIKYKDLNNDGVISTADKTYIGNPNPDFTYGFNSTMSYKNFEFTFFLQGSQGNDIFNISAINNTVDYGYGLNMLRDVYLNHWTPTKTDAKYPVISNSTSATASNRFVENGAYLRLKNIQLAYNLPVQHLNISWAKRLQIYVSAQNILTFTKYSGWDPEINSRGGANSTAQGFDYYSYPNAKTYNVGIRAGF